MARGAQGADDPAGGVTRPRPWVAAALAVVVIVAAIVIVLRLANDGPEPEGNWWLLAELILGLAYLPAGAALVVRRDRRLLGALFLVVGTMALVDGALHGVRRLRHRRACRHPLGRAGRGVLVDVAARRQRPGHPRPPRAAPGGVAGGSLAAGRDGRRRSRHRASSSCTPLTAPWPEPSGPNPLEAHRRHGRRHPDGGALRPRGRRRHRGRRGRPPRRPLAPASPRHRRPAPGLADGGWGRRGPRRRAADHGRPRRPPPGARRRGARPAHRHRPPARRRRPDRGRPAGAERLGAGVPPVPGVGAARRRHRRHLHRPGRRARDAWSAGAVRRGSWSPRPARSPCWSSRAGSGCGASSTAWSTAPATRPSPSCARSWAT